MEHKDYYKILGIRRSATTDEIKKAYRKLAVKFHPDKHKGDLHFERKFQEISEAYNVLSDPAKRIKYDRFGKDWERYETAFDNFDFNVDLKDIVSNIGNQARQGFSEFFKGLFGEEEESVGPGKADLETEVHLSFEEAYQGTERTVEFNGKSLRIQIRPGAEDQQLLRLKGKGIYSPSTKKTGDGFVKIHVESHPHFKRKGKDLYRDLNVDLYTAVLGGKATVTTLEGPVQITIPPESSGGKTLRLKDFGMPDYKNSGQKGALYVRLIVKVPKNMSLAEKELFRELAALRKRQKYSASSS